MPAEDISPTELALPSRSARIATVLEGIQRIRRGETLILDQVQEMLDNYRDTNIGQLALDNTRPS